MKLNEEAISYTWFTTLFGSLVLTITWILLLNGMNSIGVTFNLFVTNGVMSEQTANTASNFLNMFGMYPLCLLIGYFIFNAFSASNVRNVGSSSNAGSFINGAVFLLVGFVSVYILSLAGGLTIDTMESTVLNQTDPIIEISQEWKDVQSNTIPIGINMFYMSLYYIESLFGIVFIQSFLSSTSGSSYYTR